MPQEMNIKTGCTEVDASSSQQPQATMSFPKSFGILLYPRFELLDAAGPLEALICLSRREGFEDMRLSIISETMDAVSVCNGVMLLAKAGVLDGHRVTTTKDLWHLIPPLGPKSHWIARARWHHSDNIWTTSGVSAGVDGTLAWMESLVGHEIVESVVNTME